MIQTTMEDRDLTEAKDFAEQIIAMTEGMRGPKAVAGIALALACATLMAECGPRAALKLYFGYIGGLVAASGDQGEISDRYAVAAIEAALIATAMDGIPR